MNFSRIIYNQINFIEILMEGPAATYKIVVLGEGKLIWKRLCNPEYFMNIKMIMIIISILLLQQELVRHHSQLDSPRTPSMTNQNLLLMPPVSTSSFEFSHQMVQDKRYISYQYGILPVKKSITAWILYTTEELKVSVWFLFLASAFIALFWGKSVPFYHSLNSPIFL